MLDQRLNNLLLTLTLSRPEVRNAFNDELILKLTEIFINIPDNIRAIVLKGQGPVFCAGGDLEWMRRSSTYTEEQNKQDALKLAQLFQLITHCRVPVIAQVHGAAFGGGCGLVAAADITVAEKNTKFAFSEVRLGLIPATISSIVIPKIGQGHARALFTTGEAFNAEHAYNIGLVHTLAEENTIDEIVEQKVQAILSAGPNAIAKSKWLAQQPPLPIEETAELLAKARASEEGKEGVSAFLEKRKASYVTK